MDGVVQMISTVGFPIAACVLMAWFVKYQMDRNAEETASMRKEHTEEVTKITEALNNNTLALQKLVDRLDGR